MAGCRSAGPGAVWRTPSNGSGPGPPGGEERSVAACHGRDLHESDVARSDFIALQENVDVIVAILGLAIIVVAARVGFEPLAQVRQVGYAK